MALSDERRSLGARNEAIRRAGGQRVEAERRGDQGLTAALNRLIEPERQARGLRKIDRAGLWMQSAVGLTTTLPGSRSAVVAVLLAP